MATERTADGRLRPLWSRLLILPFALGVSVLLRSFVLTSFYVPSGSMTPTLAIGDRILVEQVTRRFSTPDRGSVVVVHAPPAMLTSSTKYLVKRLIGLPGERIEGRDGAVFINGERLREPWLQESVLTSDFAAVSIPAGSVFLMGDNRGNSQDSRVFGPVELSRLVGEVAVRYYPLDHLGRP